MITKKRKRGQISTPDLFMALFVFSILLIAVIILFNFYSTKLQEEIFKEELQEKAFMLTRTLLGQGKPINWNIDNVEIIGLSRYENHIDSERFNSLENIPYNDTKNILGISGFNFFIRIISLDGDFFGDYGADLNFAGSEVVSIRRFVFFNDEPAQLEVMIWRKPLKH